MSGLAALLAGRAAPGTYRWRSAFPVADVRHTVEHAGWRLAVHDGLADETRDDVLAGLGAALDFPAHYGRNLDALADCLRDVATDGVGTVLLWDAWAPFARAHPGDLARVLGVLTTRTTRPGPGHAAFAVLLRGDGPDVPGVADLG